MIKRGLEKEQYFHSKAKQLRFKNKHEETKIMLAVSKAYQLVYAKGLMYQLQPSTMCAVDRILRQFLHVNLVDFITISTLISTDGNTD
jgi:hypothetical protein